MSASFELNDDTVVVIIGSGAGVCNRYGQAHEHSNLFISDGSQFTSSAAENPTLTIVALAIRQALHIVERMSQKSL